MTNGLRISDDLQLPLEAVTQTFALLAIRRAGKSNAAVVLAEELYDAGLPWVAIDPKGDWWGVRAAGDGEDPGLSVLVLGGLHADVPLEPTAGHLVADLVVDQRLTCVLDVSEMTKADQRRFLTAFAERLYKRNREPLHVICEEADEYIPQRVMTEEAKIVRAFEVLVKRGGFRGIGITLVSQRSASLNKNVLTQVETLIPMRTTSPQDRKAVLEWVNHHAAGADAVAELPSLDNGEAYVFSPQWLDTLQRIRFRRRRTFDSGATPKVGQKPRPPARLADVDVDAIAAAMTETIEKAKAEDPKHLRARIRDLEKQLVAAAATPAVDVSAIRQVLADASKRVGDRARELALMITNEYGELAEDLETTANQVDPVLPKEGKQGKPAPRSSAPRLRLASSTTGRAPAAGSSTGRENPAAAQETRPEPLQAPDVQLKAGARRILHTLAQLHPRTVTRSQLGALSGFKVSGGTFQTYWSTLRRNGLVEEHAGEISITDPGRAFVGPVEPMTGDGVLDLWRSKLKAGARRMLDALLEVWPDGLPREDLAEQLDMTASGGTFQTYLSTLRRNGLADVRGSTAYAADALFITEETL